MDSKTTLTLIGLGAVAAAAGQAKKAATPAKSGNSATPLPAGGGTGSVIVVGGGGTGQPAPKPTTPTPADPKIPAGPPWTGEPSTTTPLKTAADAEKLAGKVSAFLLAQNPLYWTSRPTERKAFAVALVSACASERYPLDVLLGHCWAEGALQPYMTPTAGSGAYGPLQVSAITCKDVNQPYPPPNVYGALVTGIRALRVLAKRHPEARSLTNALRVYGMGYGGFQEFQKFGCSGTPCKRQQSVWRAECSCGGAANRYTWKVYAMTKKAAAAGLHTLPWAAWRGF